MGTPRNGPWLKVLLGGVAAGMVLLGVLAYAMTTTDQRPFCASCHIMQEAAVTQKMGSHAKLSCNECHAPHNLLAKLPFKVVVISTLGMSPEMVDNVGTLPGRVPITQLPVVIFGDVADVDFMEGKVMEIPWKDWNGTKWTMAVYVDEPSTTWDF